MADSVTGCLQKKGGRYYATIYYYDERGKRCSKTYATGICVEAQNKRVSEQNRRAAQRKLEDLKRSFVPPADENLEENRLFIDEIKTWLDRKKATVAPATLAGYQYAVNDITVYFSQYTSLRTIDMTSTVIEDYLTWERERRKPTADPAHKRRTKGSNGTGVENTLMHRLAVIRMVLQGAKRDGRISHNPAAKRDSWITLPKPQAPNYTVLTIEEAKRLRECLRKEDAWFELAVLFALLYGLRRSEVLGLRVVDLDMNQHRITCCNTVTQQTIDGKNTTIAKPCTKNKIVKTFVLSDEVFELLTLLMEKNTQYANEFGECYDLTWGEYIFKHPDGKLISPNRLTQKFSGFLARNGLKQLRYHDLRHSCASILYSQGVAPKTIQKILGHTQLTTTTEIYTHLFGTEKDLAVHQLSDLLLDGDSKNAGKEKVDGKIDGKSEIV